MNLRATAANAVWLAASTVAHHRFGRALANPAEAQGSHLRAGLARAAASDYGRAHGFGEIRSYSDFARRVPIVDYDDLAPWIARIQCGETNVLTTEPVTRLLPTSGSTGARKLIPFTAGLQREFNAAIGPWMTDLCSRQPSVALGPSYWSITPPIVRHDPEPSAVPVGFAEDSEYLGGLRARLAGATMAVPTAVSRATNLAQFRRLVLLSLLRCADLRLISVWHPSFLTLLLDALPEQWDTLLNELASGRWTAAEALPESARRELNITPAPGRAARLRSRDPHEPHALWPKLRVVSCWAAGHARGAATDLQRRLPGIWLQPKGLLATEAFMTLPFAGAHPLAVASHFFEFEDEKGNIQPVEALRTGGIYEIIVTTAGGLWRYRMRDRVEVDGFVERTPSLHFLGRAGNVSDRCGEKLSETFVAGVLRSLVPECPFAMLAAKRTDGAWRYALYLEGSPPADLAIALERALRANPHYALCRDLGQIGPVEVVRIPQRAYECFVDAEISRGRRLGDIKASPLSTCTDWSERFVVWAQRA
jgi:hypothetical protein